MRKLLIRAGALVSGLSVTIAALTVPAGAVTPSSCPFDFYGSGVPSTSGTSAGTGVDLGLKFSTRGTASVSGIRFYRGPSETGPVTVHLADSSGNELASATATQVTGNWYEGIFSSPVSAPADDYIAWRNADSGYNYFLTGGVQYGVGAPGDVVYVKPGSQGLYDFQPHSGAPSTPTPTSYIMSPIVDDTTNPSAPTITADVNAGSVTLRISSGYDGSGLGTAQRKLYRNGSLIADLNGSAESATETYVDNSVAGNTSYTYTTKSVDFCDNLSSASTGASVTTSTESTVWGNTIPEGTDLGDIGGNELGMRFHPTVNGYVTGVRFYRTVANTNGYVANLWDAAGNNLATGSTLTAGSVTPGWNEIRFSTPVAVNSSNNYIVSYFSDGGQYSYIRQAFTSSVGSGDVVAPADTLSSPNGLYGYTSSSAFPTTTYNSNWYGVDVIFTR